MKKTGTQIAEIQKSWTCEVGVFLVGKLGADVVFKNKTTRKCYLRVGHPISSITYRNKNELCYFQLLNTVLRFIRKEVNAKIKVLHGMQPGSVKVHRIKEVG